VLSPLERLGWRSSLSFPTGRQTLMHREFFLYVTRLMKFLFHERLTLLADRAPEVVAESLTKMVAVRRAVLFRRPPEPFRGSIGGKYFEIMLVPDASVLLGRPVIVGDIVSVPNGTEIRLSMRLSVGTTLFMIFWLGGLISVSTLLLRQGLLNGFGTTAGHSAGGLGVGLALSEGCSCCATCS